ncbi:MAG: biotin-dependent carboxyltransferase family protein [Oscillospiraceae bacterium]|jgi:biotin-dependent carboxylase-like uncharacterized protein|nr:biotin-dependent carboxyltransferase family protein [Oscillospiraceae bacterium]
MADTLTVLSPGMLTTVQDMGRAGWQSSGFSPGGAMDLPALRAANLLAGNSKDMPALEMTMTGPGIKFNCDAWFALTGADFQAELNGAPAPTYALIRASEGDELRCAAARAGCRGYLAVAGGFALEAVLGSCSTNLKCGIGGFAGRQLRAGDELPLQCPQTPIANPQERRLPVPAHLDRDRPADKIILRAVLGPQDSRFTPNGLRDFFGGWYTVAPASDRMGIKLEGAKVTTHSGSDIISDGIAAGSVQVPASGQPIVMMADRQTTGGYAKIATVISADLPLLAQAKPGDHLRFVAIAMDEAQTIVRREARAMARLEYHYLTLR